MGRSSKTLLPTAGPRNGGAGGRRKGAGAELRLSYGDQQKGAARTFCCAVVLE